MERFTTEKTGTRANHESKDSKTPFETEPKTEPKTKPQKPNTQTQTQKPKPRGTLGLRRLWIVLRPIKLRGILVSSYSSYSSYSVVHRRIRILRRIRSRTPWGTSDHRRHNTPRTQTYMLPKDLPLPISKGHGCGAGDFNSEPEWFPCK